MENHLVLVLYSSKQRLSILCIMIMCLVVRRKKLLNFEGGVEFLNVSWCCGHSCWLLLFCGVGTV